MGIHLEHTVYTLVTNFSPTFVCILTQHAVCLQQQCSNPPTGTEFSRKLGVLVFTTFPVYPEPSRRAGRLCESFGSRLLSRQRKKSKEDGWCFARQDKFSFGRGNANCTADCGLFIFPFCLNVLKLFGKRRRVNKFHVLATLRNHPANEMARVLFFFHRPAIISC